MKKTGAIIATVLGIIFVLLAGMYWLTPAGNLPSFMPGFQAGSTVVHFKHGLLALILALCAFVYAWFASAKKAM
jgi:ammonia channel protein AmtB